MAGRMFEGIVTSDKMQKTVVVLVNRRFKETRLGKIISSRKKYKVHCEDSTVKSGDFVRFVECRPMSADKRHRFVELVRKGEVVEAATTDEA